MIIKLKEPGDYLSYIAESLMEHPNISAVKVVLPTVAACSQLQKMLVANSKNYACFLPKIVPIINVGIGSEGVYNIPKEELEPISFLEQRIIISSMIRKQKPELTLSQGMVLSNHIIRLFDEIALYEISLQDLEKIYIGDDPEHWQYMFHFLSEIYHGWDQFLRSVQKIDMASHKQNMLSIMIDSVNGGAEIIMAGVIPRGNLVENLSVAIAKSANGLLLLPKIPKNMPEESHVTSKYWVYQLIQKLSALGVEANDKNTHSDIKTKPILQTFPGLLEEAQGILLQTKQSLSLGASEIAIVTSNSNLIKMLESLFDSNSINHINLNGYRLSNTKQYEFFMLLISVFDAEEINLEKFISLLKTPYVIYNNWISKDISEDIFQFEYELRKANVSSDDEFAIFIRNYKRNDNAAFSLAKKIDNDKLPDTKGVYELLKAHINLAQSIAPAIWDGDDGGLFSELLHDLLTYLSSNVELTSELFFKFNIKDYIEFIEQVVVGARYFKKNKNCQVLFMNLEDASLGGYRNIICTDMNEGSIPFGIDHDPWVNRRIRSEIGLPDYAEKIGIEWYYFGTLFDRDFLYLTRSIKVSGREAIASRFWRDLDTAQDICVNLSQSVSRTTSEKPSSEIRLGESLRYSDGTNNTSNNIKPFPSKISATNIELLIRNPYGFYAKYMLGLRKLNNVFEENSLAKFGNFLHNVIEEYTKSYAPSIPDKYSFIKNIGKNMATKYSKSHIDLWWPKFEAVIKEFLIFDDDRRADGRKVFAEIYGEMVLKIADQDIVITAIADRIELDDKGKVYILDYKTGTLPTKQDVIRGISVQMIVEAMIVEEGGFKDLGSSSNPCELTYVKIASRSPYIETVTYNISDLNLPEHKSGLVKLLEYYMSHDLGVNDNAKFAPKYDDYRHLARIE